MAIYLLSVFPDGYLTEAARHGEAAEAKWVARLRALLCCLTKVVFPPSAENKRMIPYANTYVFSVLSS